MKSNDVQLICILLSDGCVAGCLFCQVFSHGGRGLDQEFALRFGRGLSIAGLHAPVLLPCQTVLPYDSAIY